MLQTISLRNYPNDDREKLHRKDNRKNGKEK